jgi:hypothetical protein
MIHYTNIEYRTNRAKRRRFQFTSNVKKIISYQKYLYNCLFHTRQNTVHNIVII